MPVIPVNGIHVNVELAGDGPSLVLLHGFTGSAASWADYQQQFGTQFSTVAVDLIGHGGTDSPDDPARYRMNRCVDDLLSLLDHLGIERFLLLGYSMGGRTALHLAATAPERIDALILESTSPGISDPEERMARVWADEALAERIEREGVESFVDYWERLPLFASQASLPESVRQAHRDARLRNNPLGLANSLRGMGTGAMAPVHESLSGLAMPTLLLAGSLDHKYCELGHTMESVMPQARLEIVPNAGHAVHLEKPNEYGHLVLGFLQDVYVGAT